MIPEIKDFEERKENLIKKGKELGFITYEELAEELKGLEIGSDLLDELYSSINIAYWDKEITKSQADYLRKKYIFGGNDD